MSQAENLIHANLIPGGEAYAQDIDDQINHFVDRINERVESADCVSANTANKIVKRDASGNFSAGTITANLVGNVTGNADTATLADTATTGPATSVGFYYLANEVPHSGEPMQATALEGGSWRTIGPTGSGVYSVWSALDNLPSGVKALCVNIKAQLVDGPPSTIAINFRPYGSSIDPTEPVFKLTGIEMGKLIHGYSRVVIPVDSEKRFEAKWARPPGAGNNLDVYLEGWFM